MTKAFYAQSGGVTSVINSSAAGVIEVCLENNKINELLIGKYGINGLFNEDYYSTKDLNYSHVKQLMNTPSSAFGSCRRKLNSEEELNFIFKIFKRENIRYFFYNGGNDSMDTCYKINEYAVKNNYDLKVIGIPKTVDNDLYGTDHTPGFGSAAKYLAVSMFEGILDVKSMHKDSTKVFILETMGRHAGWLTASTSLIQNKKIGPDILLLPEIYFCEEKFLSLVQNIILKNDYCSIAVSEGIKYNSGKYVSDLGYKDNFGNKQLGNVGNTLADLIYNKLNIKVHTAIPDYLQRSGRHIASKVDVLEAYEIGKNAVELALKEETGYMITIKRLSSKPYNISLDKIPLNEVANKTKYLHKEYIDEENLNIKNSFIEYASPLINGEIYPEYHNGIPDYLLL